MPPKRKNCSNTNFFRGPRTDGGADDEPRVTRSKGLNPEVETLRQQLTATREQLRMQSRDAERYRREAAADYNVSWKLQIALVDKKKEFKEKEKEVPELKKEHRDKDVQLATLKESLRAEGEKMVTVQETLRSKDQEITTLQQNNRVKDIRLRQLEGIPRMQKPECPVCYEEYVASSNDNVALSPRVIECGHTLCLGCVIRLCKKHPETAECPVCRFEISTDIGWNNRPNLTLIDIIDQLNGVRRN